jgi:hypothetical protein
MIGVNVLVNAIAFKLAWLSAMVGGARALPGLVIIGVFTAIAIHLWRAAEPRRELTLIVLTGFIGLAWDSVMVAAGWLSYPNGVIVAGLAPYWIVAIWMLFATTLNVTFRWLHDRLLLAALLGAVFGPASYLAGSAAGAVELVEPLAALLALGVAWAFLMPGLLLVARQLDGTMLPSLVESGQRR